MSIVEQNELIAVFDGWQRVGSRLVKYSEREVRKPEHLFYHAHWAWLMEVVDRIETLKDTIDNIICQVTITSHSCNINYNSGNVRTSDLPSFYQTRLRSETESKIDNVYAAVVEFIQWYNQHYKK